MRFGKGIIHKLIDKIGMTDYNTEEDLVNREGAVFGRYPDL
jgi:hypothetical protein